MELLQAITGHPLEIRDAANQGPPAPHPPLNVEGTWVGRGGGGHSQRSGPELVMKGRRDEGVGFGPEGGRGSWEALRGEAGCWFPW